MSEPRAGELLGRYELLFPVAKGGMAQVWAARLRGTRGFQKTVAIKTILSSALDDARLEQMFLEEATLASQIHHPNVVGTLELGEQDGTLYLVMEWVEGESLNFIMTRALDRGGVPLSIGVNLIGQACKGLHAAHDLCDESGNLLGLVHRDISAQNILVTYSGHAKVVDFGIAKASARAGGLTEAGELKGKFAYMAPEQINAEPMDRRGDIFAMGILLYLVTTGRHPFRGSNPAETLRNICLKTPTLPTTLVAGYPVELENVVMKALERSPDDRWSTANEMLSALEHAMPQALDGSFEVSVAAYMKELLGDRASERRNRLRSAQDSADRIRVDSSQGNPQSLGSLRALAVDEAEFDAAEVSAHVSLPEIVDYAATHPSAKAPPMVRVARRAGWLVAGGVGCALVAVLVAPRFRQSRESGVAAAIREPVTTPKAEMPAPLPVPMPAPAVVVPVVREAVEDTKDAGSKHSRRPPGPTTRAPVAPSTSPSDTTQKSTPAAAPSVSAAPAAERPKPDGTNSNAWDPGAFGGRR